MSGDDGDDPRVVVHVDMDCFYASCERRRHPELAGEPVVVGMGYEPGETDGAVATASYEARAYGVESAQPISRALELLPRRATPDETDGTDGTDEADETGVYLPVDMAFYREVAAETKAVLHDLADVVREVSVDEAYLDATDRTSWAAVEGADRRLAEGYARHVTERIAREAGVPASVGVAPNMSAAKVASDHDKPDGLVVVPPGEVAGFLAPLPVVVVGRLAATGSASAAEHCTTALVASTAARSRRGAVRRASRGSRRSARRPTTTTGSESASGSSPPTWPSARARRAHSTGQSA